MILRTVVRDCLYLNWALPLQAVPASPSPLRYEVHSWEGNDYVFASALLFRHERLSWQAVPAVRISYPQFNLRLYVLDEDGVPSVLFRSILVPRWVLPAARWMARQDARPGRFDYPQARSPESGTGHWRVSGEGELEVTAEQGSPCIGPGPRVGRWEATVEHFRHRLRGYTLGQSGRLRRIDARQRRVPVWPLRAEIQSQSLMDATLPLTTGESWPALHSAWLCTEIPFVFELGGQLEPSLVRRVPAPG